MVGSKPNFLLDIGKGMEQRKLGSKHNHIPYLEREKRIFLRKWSEGNAAKYGGRVAEMCFPGNIPNPD